MKASQFTDHPRVRQLVRDLKNLREQSPDHFIFSDVIDNEGNQYVDLVQEGGGTLGVALIGYTYILEEMGIRFVSLAGTSAGAINTAMLAALGRPAEKKSPALIELLANKNFYDFIDGDYSARSFIQAINERAGMLTLFYRGLWVIDNLKEEMGLNPGRHFYYWVKDILEKHGVRTTQDLMQKMNDFPGSIGFRPTIEDPNREIRASLGIVAADLTTETKVVFPRMAELYYKWPEEVSPADYVRASMSIPLFFEPFVIRNIPRDQAGKWRELMYTGSIPRKVLMVDGGILSNFPIDIFHIGNKVPSRPTFGVKLGLERNTAKSIIDYKQLAFSCLNAACQMRDFEFIQKNPDYKQLVAVIDVGDHDWMNFEVSDEAKVDLFVKGAEAAALFLRGFDWENYKILRKGLLEAKRARPAKEPPKEVTVMAV